jgi:hypothetical protein
MPEISAHSRSARNLQDRPVTPEVAGSSPVAFRRNTVTSLRKADACRTLAVAGRFERSLQDHLHGRCRVDATFLLLKRGSPRLLRKEKGDESREREDTRLRRSNASRPPEPSRRRGRVTRPTQRVAGQFDHVFKTDELPTASESRSAEVMVSAISCTKFVVASMGAAWPAPSI